MHHYRDIVSEDGQINPRALMAIAVAQARFEREGCRKIGWERSWQDVMSASLRLVWESARVARACALARVEVATLPKREQVARQFDLKAELAETAIPPRNAEARRYRTHAQEVRAASI